MPATHALTIAGVSKAPQVGWSHEATANGRDVFRCAIASRDGSYRPALDAEVLVSESVVILTSSVANPTVVTTEEPHGIVSGQTVTIANHVGSTPAVSGAYTATRTGANTFTVPVNVTVGGTGGTVARRIFGGNIQKPSEAGSGGVGLVPIMTRIDAVDFNAVTERRFVNEVLAAGTLKSQLVTLAANYGLTLHSAQVNGPDVGALPCEYAALRSVLDKESVLTNYVWEFDEYDRLRMYLPNAEAAPINVVTGDGNAIGDITVEPTRTNYANYVILRFSEVAQKAYGFLSTTGNFGDANEVVLGSTTYVFQTVLTNVAGHVLIGGSAAASLSNLIAAITLGAGSGTVYAALTTVNASAEAYAQTSTMMKARAVTAGAAGNSIACSTTAANASWIGEGSVPLAALALGADQSLTNVSIASYAAEIAAHGRWEAVIQSPETTSQAAADILSAAYLAVHLPVPDTVRYDTYAVGLRPGQTQTITVPTRNINNTFLITDVSTKHLDDAHVLRSVTAIESLLLQSADRWRDTYKLWSGDVSGSAALIGGGTIIQAGGTVYSFGGSQTEWQQTLAGGWVAANSTRVLINTAVRGSLIGTCYVWLRSAVGSVTARVRNITDGATVGTSVAITNTSLTLTSFGVVLTAGARWYEIDLSPSVADTDIQLGSSLFE